MPDRPPSNDPKRSAAANNSVDKPTAGPSEEITEEKMEEILIRARQTVKPIINREAANEVVSEEILSFKMKSI